MNIHFTDEKVFEELKRLSVFSIPMGSQMYGTADTESDVDILYIYVPSYDEMNSIAFNHHQFQYKSNGVDFIFSDIFNFIKNALNGDATINFEVLNHPSLIGTELEFLYNMRTSFHNHKIIRSYLGFARRDLKHISKGKTDRDKNKKLNHVLRGYTFCQMILNKKFNPLINPESKLFKDIQYNKTITDSRERHEIGEMYKDLVALTRDDVNRWLDEGSLGFPQYMSDSDMHKLDTELAMKVTKWRNGMKDSFYFDKLKPLIYDAVANGIKYDDSGNKYMV